MQAAKTMIDDRQRRRIFGAARGIGMDNDDLHALTADLTGKESPRGRGAHPGAPAAAAVRPSRPQGAQATSAPGASGRADVGAAEQGVGHDV